ncbi:MAG: rhamnulokinase, partial [Oscillospiraceae bacterium]|nr:rhamnulokinase [Oscillospiraceae bacterium]
PAVAYRDEQAAEAGREAARIISQDELYTLTGIQKQAFNTVYQLYRDKKSGKLDAAAHFLMMPEYLSFKLCGKIENEYTNATTTNLINAGLKTWENEIFSRLGLPHGIFKEPKLPCTSLGRFTEEVKNEVGFDAEVIFCPSHDTASAVAACPIDTDCVYISSGTWSLIGTENEGPVLSDEAKRANFTNEGGIDYRFRFLKNIMGMWLFQSIRRDLGKRLTYDDMMHLAEKSRFEEYIDPNAGELVAPENMIEAIRTLLQKPELPIEDVLKCVYISLAKSYADAVREIERISGKEIREIHIVGGGSRDGYLNRLTRQYTGKKVFVGLSEATATGNILAQIIYDKKIPLSKAREMIKNSFNVREIL